jgi:RNA polymerase sigma factor (sigma-70 family)
MKVYPDQDLIEAAVQGNTEAIETLLLQYSPLVTKFARKYCATPEDVEDAVQETLWVASQKIGTLRVVSAFVSWLFNIVKHQCFRLLKIGQHTETEIFDNDQSLFLVDDNPELQILLRQDVVKALIQLPIHHRQVVIMRDLEGMSTAEVADALEITIPTVKSRLHQGRNTLRELLVHWSEG